MQGIGPRLPPLHSTSGGRITPRLEVHRSIFAASRFANSNTICGERFLSARCFDLFAHRGSTRQYPPYTGNETQCHGGAPVVVQIFDHPGHNSGRRVETDTDISAGVLPESCAVNRSEITMIFLNASPVVSRNRANNGSLRHGTSR